MAPPPASNSNSSILAEFLSRSKENYLQDARTGNVSEWTVVMGNEAGDLDSIASSIAFAWLRTNFYSQPTISLIQMNHEDLDLRAENIHALHLAGLSKPRHDLLFLSDILPTFQFLPSSRLALVDHNRLLSTFSKPTGGSGSGSASTVVAVIDHHADEGLYTDTANPRIVAPSGSCSSHVSILFQQLEEPNTGTTGASVGVEIPPELATLLLSAILIDTDGLALGGKAIDVDRKAASFLIPKSTLASSVSVSSSSSSSLPNNNTGTTFNMSSSTTTTTAPLYSSKPIQSLSQDLSTKKLDVSHLTPRDLLRRDYKEYEFTLPWYIQAHPTSTQNSNPTRMPSIRAGLSSIPLGLKSWASNGTLESEGEKWMKERGIHVLGMLTSYRGEKKGKRKREMGWIVRTDLPAHSHTSDSHPHSHINSEVEVGDDGDDGDNDNDLDFDLDFDALAKRLWKGLEADTALEAKEHDKFANGTLTSLSDSSFANLRVRVYRQNPHATRKATAPVLKGIMESTE